MGVGGDKGLPSRVRGKPKRQADKHEQTRITLACAGKTRNTSSRASAPRDHPRVCGENRCGISIQSVCAGSPPRVRGKPTTTRRGSRPRGITPACAGKTSRIREEMKQIEDHPRVCGENSGITLLRLTSRGSPPRVRGKPEMILRGTMVAGITPACAGKTDDKEKEDRIG